MTTNDLSSTVPRKWYHTTLCNALIIGGVGFVAPGLWDALNALGAGGAEEPFLINAANALVFGLSKLIWGYPLNTHRAHGSRA